MKWCVAFAPAAKLKSEHINVVMQVSRLVRENLTRRALRFNLVLDDVSITHVAFSPEFTHAVEAKQVCSMSASTRYAILMLK